MTDMRSLGPLTDVRPVRLDARPTDAAGMLNNCSRLSQRRGFGENPPLQIRAEAVVRLNT